MTAHKWADEIKAWALDRDCIEQCLANQGKQLGDNWHPFNGAWTESPNWVYRIKPKPMRKPDMFVRTPLSFYDAESDRAFTTTNAQLLFDGETLQLKSVRMIGKPDPDRMEALLRKIEDADSQYFFTKAELTEALRTD